MSNLDPTYISRSYNSEKQELLVYGLKILRKYGQIVFELTNEESIEFGEVFKRYSAARKLHGKDIDEAWIQEHLAPLPKGRALHVFAFMIGHWSSRYTIRKKESRNLGHQDICIIDRASAQ